MNIIVTGINGADLVFTNNKTITSAISITDPDEDGHPVEEEPSLLYDNERNVLRLMFYDLQHQCIGQDYYKRRPWMIFPNESHVKQVIDFTKKHQTGNMLIHCSAGVSRSAALGLIAGCILFNDVKEAFRKVLRWNKGIYPNNLLIEYGDNLLGLNGELISMNTKYKKASVKALNVKIQRKQAYANFI